MKYLLLTSAIAAAGLTFSTAQALTVEADMDVQITIVDACEITVAPSLLDFGTHGVLAADIDSTSTMSVTCTNGAAYNIGLNGGTTGTVAARVMTLGTEDVSYQLYREAGRTNIWGDTINTDTVAATGTGIAVVHTVYGRVPGPQPTPTAGVYTDTVHVTVTY